MLNEGAFRIHKIISYSNYILRINESKIDHIKRSMVIKSTFIEQGMQLECFKDIH